MFKELEKLIIVKIRQVETKAITPKESNLGTLLNRMKQIDEPCYDTLIERYKKALGA